MNLILFSKWCILKLIHAFMRHSSAWWLSKMRELQKFLGSSVKYWETVDVKIFLESLSKLFNWGVIHVTFFRILLEYSSIDSCSENSTELRSFCKLVLRPLSVTGFWFMLTMKWVNDLIIPLPSIRIISKTLDTVRYFIQQIAFRNQHLRFGYYHIYILKF